MSEQDARNILKEDKSTDRGAAPGVYRKSWEKLAIARIDISAKYPTKSAGTERTARNKVFVIGWHRTGTRSIKHALDILGFRGLHWWPGWLDQPDVEKSPILRKYDAFADFPFPLIYRQLDGLYPRAKFILTTRSSTSWLRSVKEHFDDAHWNRDGIGIRIKRVARRAIYPGYLSRDNRRVEAERMFKIAYGRTTFDPDVFLERFKRHNEEVDRHFGNRHEKLLVMDLEGNCDWNKLCPFLGLPKPNKPYPHLFSLRG